MPNHKELVAFYESKIQMLESKLAQVEVYNNAAKAKISPEEWKTLFRDQLNVNIMNTLHMQGKVIDLLYAMQRNSSDKALVKALEELEPIIKQVTTE